MATNENDLLRRSDPDPQELDRDEFLAQQARRGDPEGGDDGEGDSRGVVPLVTDYIPFLPDRAKEIVRSSVRGSIKGTVTEPLAALGDVTGIDALKAPDEKLVPFLYGRRSDDGVASFTEGASQAMSAFVGLGKIKVAGKALGSFRGAKGLASAAARGVVVDFAAFDPMEGDIAGMIDQTGDPAVPVPDIVSHAAEMLSVDDDDSRIEARMKHVMQGAILGVTLDGMVAGVRFIRAKRAAEAATRAGDSEAVAQAVQEMETHAGVMRDVAEGTHSSADDVVSVNRRPDGQFEVTPKDDIDQLMADAGMQVDEAGEALPGNRGAGSGLGPKAVRDPAVPDQIFVGSTHEEAIEKLHRELGKFRPAEGGGPGQRRIVESGFLDENELFIGAEEAQKRQAALRQAKDGLAEVRESMGPFKDKAEAEAAAASANAHIKARTSPNVKGKLTDFQKQEIIETAQELARAAKEGDASAVARLAKGTHFNFSTYGETDQTLAVLDAMTETMEKHFRKAAQADGVPIEETLAMARKELGGMPAGEMQGLVEAGVEPLGRASVRFVSADMMMKDLARQVGDLGQRLDARPHDAAVLADARQALTSLYRIGLRVSGARSEIGRTLRVMQDLGRDGAGSSGLRRAVKDAEEEALDGVITGGKNARREAVKEASGGLEDGIDIEGLVAGYKPREVRAITNMMRLTDDPRNLTSAIKATRVLKVTGNMAKAQELFVNGILSAPTTLATVAQSGFSIAVFEPTSRILAGLKTGDAALAQEGRDLLYGSWKFASEGFEAMRMAWRAGHTIMDNQPTTKAIGGVTGEIVRTPGRAMMSLDEFIKTVQYRSWIRAKSLRDLRGQGLSNAEIEKRVADNLRAAYDEKTGVATIPEGMEFARRATMSSPLSSETAGRAAQRVISEVPVLRYVAPFTRAPINLLSYARDITPGVNRSTQKMRRVLEEGGEEAAIAKARSQIVGTAMVGAFGLYASGNLTGSGPEDPSLRKTWLENNKPYSVKLPTSVLPGVEGDKWISYNRADPIGIPFGIMADIADAIQHAESEYAETGPDAIFDAMTAVFAGTTEAISNRSYLQSVAEFFGAMSGNATGQMERLLSGITGGHVPFSSLLRNMNPDPVLRDARGFTDQIKRGIPGLSNTLPPVFNMYGEKVYRSPSGINNILNRFNPNTIRDAGDDPVVKEMVELGKGLSPPSPTKRIRGQEVVDLLDEDLKSRPDQELPYVRWMELIENPGRGQKNLREELADLVTSKRFQEMSGGTPVFKGGRKMAEIEALADKHYARAERKMVREYPKIRELLRAGHDAFKGSIVDPESAPQSLEAIRQLIQ